MADQGSDALWPLTWILWAPIGCLILLKRAGNGVGRTCLAIGLGWGVGFALLAPGVAVTRSPLAAWVELGQLVLGVLPWIAIVWLLLIFPSGELSRRWERVVATLLIALGLFVIFGFVVSPGSMEETGLPSPLQVPALGPIARFATSDTSFSFLLVLVLSAVVLLVRRWRGSAGVDRLQYRWLLSGALLFLVAALAGQFLPADSPADFTWLLAGSAIPAAIGVAILRYRLYEIDRIISRTVSYALVVGLLAALYLGALTWLTTLLPDRSQLVVAAATLGVAALFNPLRRGVQGAVDRRFNRSRYDAQRVVDGFAESLRDEVDSDQVMSGWVGVVSKTMQPAAVAVWVRETA